MKRPRMPEAMAVKKPYLNLAQTDLGPMEWEEVATKEDLETMRERLSVSVVDSFPDLGKMTAWKFMRWVQNNPNGVCSLPTGKTPEFFIKWTQKILKEWDSEEIRKEATEQGLSAEKPIMSGLTFVQIDEFYPLAPTQENSFYHYVNEFYIRGFGMDKDKAMLIDATTIGLRDYQTLDDVWPGGKVDLSLRMRAPGNDLEKEQQRLIHEIDQWCAEYEQKIRSLGGIGFFLGGIGPDGHVAFNCRGCDHHCTTRLDALNYPSQAACAGDLGGIEAVKKRKVITIGLATVTFNPHCVAIICAAGEAKAAVCRDAILKPPHVLYPATALHQLPNALFLLTRGAAKLLPSRQVAELLRKSYITIEDDAQNILVALCVKCGLKLQQLTAKEAQNDILTRVLLKRSGLTLEDIARRVEEDLISKIARGCERYTNTTFVHTEPHHDDIMLGYLPAVVRNTREKTNEHHFICCTSGFNSVSNTHLRKQVTRARQFIRTRQYATLCGENYFRDDDVCRRRDVWQFLDGVASRSESFVADACARRFIRNLLEVYKSHSDTPLIISERLDYLDDYLNRQYTGQKDISPIQVLKGTVREWEAECLWGYLGWNIPNISHLRLGFYTADIFVPEPSQERDVVPILDILSRTNPDVVTVALDPEASGPDTHYKVLQAVTAAVQKYVEDTGRHDLKIWGYRNVWYRFDPWEATTIVPTSLQMMCAADHMFLNAFESQKDAEFPSHEVEGPFCDMARKVQTEQYHVLSTCLGSEWFHEHESPLIRATRGLVYFKEMNVQELSEWSRSLMCLQENAEPKSI
eukprot:GEMP01008423.1.p1 GENE.GEMP01008423.1~~GEMP01008423.1.p1  ORF type:complete len:804 (+),score=214.74 GEMP01008423.1:75-2486(+)